MLKIYSTKTCPWCFKAKQFMDEEGIDYQEIDVTTDADGQRDLIALTNQRSVPVVVLGEKFVLGFDPDGIRQLNKAANSAKAISQP